MELRSSEQREQTQTIMLNVQITSVECALVEQSSSATTHRYKIQNGRTLAERSSRDGPTVAGEAQHCARLWIRNQPAREKNDRTTSVYEDSGESAQPACSQAEGVPGAATGGALTSGLRGMCWGVGASKSQNG